MFKLMNVTAMWPKLDRPYRFDKAENRSVPCDPLADGAEYEVEVEFGDKAQAVALKAYIDEVFDAFVKLPEGKGAVQGNKAYWSDDHGVFHVKTKLKASYNGEATKKPLVVDSNKQPVADDFKLTSGSTINIAFTGVPYKGMGGGVSLRIRAIQVIELAEGPAQIVPFDEVSGGYTGGAKPFGEIEQPKKVNGSADSFEDDIPF